MRKIRIGLCFIVFLLVSRTIIYGAPGYSLQFLNTSSNQTVGIPFVPELNLYPFTVMAWIKAGAQPADGIRATPIIIKPTAGMNGWNLSIFNGEIRASYTTGSGANYVSDGGLAANGGLNGGPAGDDQWHHVAFTVDSSGGKIYVDGALQTNKAWVGTPGPTTIASPIYFGLDPMFTQYVGLLDEVSIWNVALTQSQIQTNKGRSLTGYEPGLIAYYKCDESTGPTSYDSAPAGGFNNGFWNGVSAVPSNAPIAFLPVVQTLPATAVGQTSVTLNGTVNPLGTNASAWFEWGTTTNYGNVTPALSVGSGTNDVNFARNLTGLTAFTTYHFRAVASNAVGIALATNQTFQTSAALPPGVTTLPAKFVFAESATLRGATVARGLPTWAWFEWGTTTNYGNVTSAQSIGDGETNVNFSRHITTIPLGSNCNFRAVASNAVGVTRGQNLVAVPQLFTHGNDINLITGTETYPRVTQNEPAIWSHSNTIVVAYNDSRALPSSFGCASVSTNGGESFTRLNYFFNQIGQCGGRPSVFYSVKAEKWYITFLADGCGSPGPGIGIWTSTNGVNWTPTFCLGPTPDVADGPSTWVDNNSGSPFYGRIYVAFNDFQAPQPLGYVRVSFSLNSGTNWNTTGSLGTPLTATRRAGKIIGSRGTDGTVFLPMLDESGGGTNLTRIHYLARSTNGGGSWTFVQVTPPVAGPGRSVSGYFAGMFDAPVAAYWREMGWGQAGVGPNGVVHYAYSASTTNEPYDANIYYTRSTDNGLTWSSPIQLNTDDSLQRQWNPSVSVNPKGVVFVTWYDERNVSGTEYFGRASLDNGVTWGVDAPVSDISFPRPHQADPSVPTNFFGLYVFSAFSDDGYGDTAYHAWVDGRVIIDNTYRQMDVFFDQITFDSALRIRSITRAGNGDIIVLGTGTPNLSHSLQLSPSLAPGSFTNVAQITPNAYGVWKYNAGQATGARRFFRAAYP